MASSISRARILYKTILKLHRGLPQELKEFGDKYLKEEFKRHKDADSQFQAKFFKEWNVSSLFYDIKFFQTMLNVLLYFFHSRIMPKCYQVSWESLPLANNLV